MSTSESSLSAGRGPGIALVTGAGSGIGRGVARKLFSLGWKVALMGRREDPLKETAQGFESHALVVTGDVSNEHDVDRVFAAIVDRWARLDLLFNNAGIFPPGQLIDELSVENWRASVDVNLTGAFLCARAAFGQMRKQSPQGGRIINNGSISAHSPRPQSVGYTATKHAITGLTKSLSLDGRPFDIACGPLANGNRSTRITLVPRKAKEDFIFPSKESTRVNTAMMAKIPTVTPKRDKMVRVRFDLRAVTANLKLSQVSWKNSIRSIVG